MKRLLLIHLLLVCYACGSSSSASLPVYGELCRDKALYCASIIGNYTDEYEIVSGPMLSNPDIRHAECRAKIGDQWYWLQKLNHGCGLTKQRPDIDLDHPQTFTYDLIEFAELIAYCQQMTRLENESR